MRSEKEIKVRLMAVIATMLESKDYETFKQMKDTLEWVLSDEDAEETQEESEVA